MKKRCAVCVRVPDVGVDTTSQLLRVNRIDVVTKPVRTVTRRSGRFSSSLIFTV